MEIEIKVPTVGESISEVEIADWPKAEGDFAEQDEVVAVFETDKATVELPAPVAGRITRIVKHAGEKASVGDVVGYMEQVEQPAATKPVPSSDNQPPAKPMGGDKVVAGNGHTPSSLRDATRDRQMPPAEREQTTRSTEPNQPAAPARKDEGKSKEQAQFADQKAREIPIPAPAGEQKIVHMSTLRRRIAERLVEAQKTAALLTTFNEIDTSALSQLRQKYQEAFQKKHGIKLGIMSFFVKASIEALKLVPRLNAQIRGADMVFHDFYDIGVAVGAEKGLVVPVLRNAERMSFAEIEAAIDDFVRRARENKLGVDELEGGTFTITNGGIYGSLFSTPIVNPPQSGVLGMHAIQERPVARQGQVLVRPMMYVALTYDHRIVDGHEAVTFLKHVKDLIEEPARMLLEI
jgi:2-oxoglutarate dehydrogenase E2 component (dihydrolipoamide succinyltransferase)